MPQATLTPPATDASTFVVAAMNDLSSISISQTPEGRRSFKFLAAPGLYQFSLYLDASEFDWESLYQVLNSYGNVNKRTGPWDFDLPTAAPVVPSYWIWIDGKKIGLWYVQRVQIEDIQAKRFRGRLAFHLSQPGEHELVFEPYKTANVKNVKWISSLLEPDPEDQLKPATPKFDASAVPAAKWADPKFWEIQRAKLDSTHIMYKQRMEQVFDWATSDQSESATLIPALVAAHHLGGRKDALKRALELVEIFVSKPAWGRPREDVYSHNGDIGAGDTILNMCKAYHMLAPELGPDGQKRLLDKLVYQCDQFINYALLMRDYWGGSILQDHGRKAVFDYAAGVMHLWGLTPAAEYWVSWVIPRCQRGLDAAPPEGYIPGSSYYSIFMYAHGATWYRDALLARTGHDIIGEPSLRNLPHFVSAVMHEGEHAMLIADGDYQSLIGGQAIMAYIASKFRDQTAARVHKLLVESPKVEFFHGSFFPGFFNGILWGYFAYDPTVEVAPPPANASHHLHWFQDAGLVQYRNDRTSVALALRCGPWLGYHAHRSSLGPCDRMEMSVGAGHFTLFLDGKPVLCTPDGGYRLTSFLRSIMLIDGKGQIGDVGYPMSIPSLPHRGEEIENVRFDPATGEGVARLNLTRCYPAELGLAQYTRQFLFSDERKIVCRDHVVLTQPAQLSWAFQHQKLIGSSVDALIATIGQDRPKGLDSRLTIQPKAAGASLVASLEETDVVRSYSSSTIGKPFYHVKYATKAPVLATVVDFVLTW